MHNLKNIDVEIPRNSLVVFTGLSGSGKSSLAFDTIYAEGQRRFMETLSVYARQFIGDMEKPEVDKITGLSPAISIEQKTVSHNPRSTVGTVTEIYDFIRLLFARCGTQFSPDTGKEVSHQNIDQIFEIVMRDWKGKKINILAPKISGRKGLYKDVLNEIADAGFTKIRLDREIVDLSRDLKLSRYQIHDIDIVIDRLTVEDKHKIRIYDSLEVALRYGSGTVIILSDDDEKLFNEKLADSETGRSFSELNPNTFSFNSQYGWCPECQGLGVITHFDEELIFPDKKLSFEEGGIAPIGKPKKSWMSLIVSGVLEEFGTGRDVPVKNYSKELIKALLNGIPDRKINVKFSGASGSYSYKYKYGGLIQYLKSAYEESGSVKHKEFAESFLNPVVCSTCHGGRLKEDALWVRVGGKNIRDIVNMSITDCHKFFSELKLEGQKQIIAEKIVKELKTRLEFLLNVGLEYLTLDRSAKTLSGGEAQRIRLATQIGTKLSGVLYILDEPSIGLHQRDNIKLIKSLMDLRDLGNSVIVVEHDREMIESANYVVDLGPRAGEHGGWVVATGKPSELDGKSITAAYLSGKKKIEVRKERRKGNGQTIELKGASGNNLRKVNLKIHLGKFICITGVSGSGKSTLINDTLYKILMKKIYGTNEMPLPYESFSEIIKKENKRTVKVIDKVIEIDQTQIGRTPRSNPATYTGLFTHIRDIFASLPESKIRGYKIGRFTFNVKGGRCDACDGAGLKKIEMNFLPDVYVTCDVCKGKRYNSETLQIRFKGKNIADVLEMTVEEAVDFFKSFPSLHRKLSTLYEVGLGYIRLGQQATTLSGGEAQRVKLATELSKVQTGRTIYMLDEPTTGLHFEDINMLLKVLNKLVDKGNTVIVIEHNLDVIKNADWIIDLGPEGGDKGGKIIAEGTPEDLVKKYKKVSHTAYYLEKELK